MKFLMGLMFFKIRARQLSKAMFNLDYAHWIAAVLNPRTSMLKVAKDAEQLYAYALISSHGTRKNGRVTIN